MVNSLDGDIEAVVISQGMNLIVEWNLDIENQLTQQQQTPATT